MGIFKDSLYPYVNDQFYIRQSMIAHGLSQYGKGPQSTLILGESKGYRGGGAFNPIAVGTNMEGIGSYAHFSSLWKVDSKNRITGELKNPDVKPFPIYHMDVDEIEERDKKRGFYIPTKYWHSWMTQRYCGIRMASMIDLTEENILDLDYEFNGVVLEEIDWGI